MGWNRRQLRRASRRRGVAINPPGAVARGARGGAGERCGPGGTSGGRRARATSEIDLHLASTAATTPARSCTPKHGGHALSCEFWRTSCPASNTRCFCSVGPCRWPAMPPSAPRAGDLGARRTRGQKRGADGNHGAIVQAQGPRRRSSSSRCSWNGRAVYWVRGDRRAARARRRGSARGGGAALSRNYGTTHPAATTRDGRDEGALACSWMRRAPRRFPPSRSRPWTPPTTATSTSPRSSRWPNEWYADTRLGPSKRSLLLRPHRPVDSQPAEPGWRLPRPRRSRMTVMERPEVRRGKGTTGTTERLLSLSGRRRRRDGAGS